jgi:hypothetical protein
VMFYGDIHSSLDGRHGKHPMKPGEYWGALFVHPGTLSSLSLMKIIRVIALVSKKISFCASF